MNNAFKVPEFLWTYDPRPIPQASYPGMMPFRTSMAGMGTDLFFVHDDGVNGFELWKTNGITPGTSLVRDINTNANRESRGGHLRLPNNFTVMNGFMYFSAYNRSTGFELYRTDGTTGNTTLILDIFTGSSNGEPRSGNPSNLTVIGNTLFFTATNGSGTELWKTDGTPSGTVMVTDLAAGSASSSPASLTVVGSTLFFSAANAAGDRELYRCDGPGYNTITLVRDINPSGSSDPQNLHAHDGRLFFSATDGVTGRELYKSESPFNSGSTTLIRNIWTSGGALGNSNPKNFFSFGSRLLFAANDSINGAELWSSVAPYDNGGTAMLVNINTTARGSSFPNWFTQIGDTVFFRAQNASNGFELWKTAGTVASTRMIADINPGAGGSGPQHLTAFDGRLWFTANNGTGGRELYYTGQGVFNSVTRLEIAAGSASSDPLNFRVHNGRLFFTADDITNGFELWSVAAGSTTPARIGNATKVNSPAGWRNISKGPDYTNLTGNSNPWDNENPAFDWDDSDTWVTNRPQSTHFNLAGIGDVTPSFDKKQIYINTQTGSYRWIGSGWEWILSIREGFSIYPTNNGFYLLTRDSGIKRIMGAVTTNVGNYDFYPTCVHSSVSNFSTPNDGLTLYATKFDMRVQGQCGWSAGFGALMGIYRVRINEDKQGATRNIALSSGGYIGGTGLDAPVGAAWGGRPGPNPARKADLFVAGNFDNTLPALKNRLPAQEITFNQGGYVTTTSAKALVYHYNAASDTLKKIIYLGTNGTDVVTDFEYINQRPAPGIGRRMAVAGTFGVVVLDSAGSLLWRVGMSQLPWTQTSGELMVDIDRNGHVVVMRPNNPAFNHPFVIYDENGNQITGVTNGFRQFAHDIAIQNDTVVITGFRNGCLPSTPPYCNGGGGNTGGCGGAEVQTAYIFFYRKGATASDPMVMYAKTYDFPDGAQGRDIADTRGYCVNFGADGKLYFAGESAGSETIYRWPGIENSTVELNSVRLGICDGTSLVPNGSVSSAGMRAVMRRTDLSNTASAHIAFYGQVDYQRVTPGGYCEVMQGEMLIPRNSDGKSNTFKLSGRDGYITADKDGAVYMTGTSSFKFAGRDAQKVNGQEIGIYNGDITVMVTNPNFGERRFWGTLAMANPVNGRSGTGKGRGIAVLDTLVAYVAQIDTNTMAVREPTQSMTQMGLTRTKPDGYLAIFHTDLSKFANRDSIVETVRGGDTIIPPDFTRLAANFTANRSTVCLVGGPTNTTATFTLTAALLNPTNNPNWRWNVRWDFGPGASLVSGNATFNGTANNQLTGYVNPTVQWNSTGLKTITLRIIGYHPTFDSVQLSETKFNFVNVFPLSVAAQTLSGPGSNCPGGVGNYRVTFDQTTTFGISSYVWSVPAGATILSGNGGPQVRVRFGNTSGPVSVYAIIPCGVSQTISRNVTITAPVREAFMLVGSLALTPGETNVRNELISRGFNVTTREDNDYDTLDFYCKNLIVVTPTVDSVFVGDRLRRITTPVIIMNPRLLPSMAMTAAGNGTNYGFQTGQTMINVTNAGPNDLLGGMTTGNQTVLSANIGKSFGWGNPLASAIRIATVPGNTSRVNYFAYDAGAVMNNSYAAPARRVFFFPGERLAIDSLNTLGRTLVGRTICWATNSCNIPLITAVDFGRRSFFPFDSVSIRFTSVGTFLTGNTFTIQWSDRFGDFSNATNTTVSSVHVGNNPTNRLIQMPMPTLPAGTDYAVRIVSSNPATFSNAITGIRLFDPLTGPAKIIYITNKFGPSEPLDVQDTAMVAMLGQYSMPVEYCRTTDINAARLAGARLIVIGPNANTSTPSTDAQWNVLRSINVPILNLHQSQTRLGTTGLSMFTNVQYPYSQQTDANNIWVRDTTYGSPFSGNIPLFLPGVPGGVTCNYLNMGGFDGSSNYVRLIHGDRNYIRRQMVGRFGPGANDSSAFAFVYDSLRPMAANFAAPSKRGWLGLNYGSNNRLAFLTWQGKAFVDRMIRYMMNLPAAEITSATVQGVSSLCEAGEVTINLQHNGRMQDNNQYLVQLSGPNGRFDEPGYPILLTTEDGPIFNSIDVKVPAGLPSSSLYRVRISTSRPAREIIVWDTARAVLVDDINATTRSSNRGFSRNSNGTVEEASNLAFFNHDPALATVNHSYTRISGTDNTWWLRYTPTIPATGAYEVRVIYPGLQSAPTAAQFRIIHAAGTTTSTVNQTLNPATWISLGTYTFNAGTSGYVELVGSSANMNTAVDALLFVRNFNAPNSAGIAGQKSFSIGNVWTGAADNNWHNPANWSLCDPTPTGVPDTTTVVSIPSLLDNPNNFPIVSNGDAAVRSLTISAGDAKMWVRNGRLLRVTQQLVNEDTLRFMEGGAIIGSGTREALATNSGVILVDEGAHYKAIFTNTGTMAVNNYAGNAVSRFHQIINTTGYFVTRGPKTVTFTREMQNSASISFAASTTINGDITQTTSAGRDTLRPGCRMNGNLNIISGNIPSGDNPVNLNLITTAQDDSIVFNGNVFLGNTVASSIGGNRRIRLICRGLYTNEGRFNIDNGTNGDRPTHLFIGEFVNNGVMRIRTSPGGDPGIFITKLVNNSLFETGTGGAEHVFVGGNIINNGLFSVITNGSGHLFEFDNITNSGILSVDKGQAHGQNLTNLTGGTVTLARTTNGTTRHMLRIANIDNAGTMTLSDFANTGTGGGMTLIATNIRNRAGGTLNIGLVSNGSNNGRVAIVHGDLINDGTMTLNADLNMASKLNRTQRLQGLATVGNLTISNTTTVADTGNMVQFDPPFRNMLFGSWTSTTNATRIGGNRWSVPASANPDSAVLYFHVPAPGNYHVEIFASTFTDRALNGTPHRVFAGGAWHNFNVNQRTQGNPWHRLTTTPIAFTGDGTEKLVIGGRAHTDGTFGADAARIIYVNGGNFPQGGAVQLGSPLTVTGTLNLETNRLFLTNNNLTIGSSGTITGANASRYIVTGNSTASGRLIQNVAAGERVFPVGIDSSYSPVAITNGGNQNIAVNVMQGVRTNVTTGSFVSENIVDRTWVVSPTTQATGTTVKLTWNGPAQSPSNELTGFDRTSGSLSLLGSTTTTWANLGLPGVAGTGPYTSTNTGVTLNPETHVALSSGALVSQDRVWNGSVSTAWGTAANWTPAGVPTLFSKVTIPGSVPNNPLITTGNNFGCLELEVTTGTLNMNGGTLTVNGNIRRNAGGTMNLTGGAITVSGSSPASIIGPITFNNLTVANTVTFSNTVNQVNNLTIASNGRLLMPADSNASELRITGLWDNSQNGVAALNGGTLVMQGSSQQQLLGTNKFRNLTINNAAGVVIAATDTVTGTLTLSSGNLILGEHNLIMDGPSATFFGASNGSYVRTATTNSGGIIRARVGAAAYTFPVGTSTYTPVTISNGGNLVHDVRVFNGVTENAITGTNITERAVNRTWFVNPDVSAYDRLMDNTNPEFIYVDSTVDLTGKPPTLSTTGPGINNGSGWNNSFWQFGVNLGSSRDEIRVTPTFAASGWYEVFVYFPSGSNSGSTPHIIRHADGITTINVNQNLNHSRWLSLGIYRFNLGYTRNHGSVRIPVASGGDTRYADAFRFNFRGAVTGATNVALTWNGSEELANFNPSRVRMGAHTGSQSGWAFQSNINITPGYPRTATTTNVGTFPYLCVGGWGTNTWTGTIDSSWTNPGNWSIAVPDAGDDVVIPQVVTSNRSPRVGPGEVAWARSLTLTGGTNGRLRISGGVLNLAGDFTNNGVLTHTDGKIIISGSAPATITGANNFRRLEIRNGSGVSLPTSTTVVSDSFIVNSGVMTMNGGVLTVNGPLRLRNSNSRIVMNVGLLTVRGNLDNSAGGQIISSATAGAIDFAGTTGQTITGNSNFRNVTISNTSLAGVTFSGLDSVVIQRDLVVNANTRFNMNSGRLVVLNNIVGNGIMTLTGSTTVIRGTGNQTILGAPSFGDLMIDKPSGTLTMPSVLNTTGTVNVNAGSVTLPQTASYSIGNLRLGAAGSLTLTGGTLQVNNTWDARPGGAFNQGAGAVIFGGTTKGRILGNLTLGNFTMNKTGITAGADTVVVENTLTVNGQITHTRGYLSTHTTGLVQLGPLATMTTETNGARVVGRISQSLNVNGIPVNFGGGMVNINPGTESLGLVEVSRVSGLARPGLSFATTPEFPSSKSIDALWFIEPALQPQNPVQFSLRWPSALDNGNNRNLRLFAWRRPAPYTGSWEKNGTAPITFSDNTATITTSQFSQWTVNDENNPLPVELGAFTGNWNEKSAAVDLTWFTFSEKNNSHFIVERSQDQHEWSVAGTVAGRGTSYVNTRYNLSDPEAHKGLNYYRLTQVDLDGTVTRLQTIAVMVGKVNAGWRMFPNPTFNLLMVEGTGIEGNKAEIRIVDMLGRTVRSVEVPVTAGAVQHRLELGDLTAGMYVVKTIAGDGIVRTTLVEKKK